MNLAYNYQLTPDFARIRDMEQFIAGTYWEKDIWNLNDLFWDDYNTGRKSFTSRRMFFQNIQNFCAWKSSIISQPEF